jgi:hypothetical protein
MLRRVGCVRLLGGRVEGGLQPVDDHLEVVVVAVGGGLRGVEGAELAEGFEPVLDPDLDPRVFLPRPHAEELLDGVGVEVDGLPVGEQVAAIMDLTAHVAGGPGGAGGAAHVPRGLTGHGLQGDQPDLDGLPAVDHLLAALARAQLGDHEQRESVGIFERLRERGQRPFSACALSFVSSP